MSESLIKSELEANFDTLVTNYNQLREVTTEELSRVDNQQKKYAVVDLAQTRETLDKVAVLVRRVTHQDYYFLPEGAHPSYLTECICLREEKDLDTSDGPIKTTFMYKSNPHNESGTNNRTVKSVEIPEDIDGAYAILELLEAKFGEPYAQIYKERQIYVSDETNVYVDTHVIAIDPEKHQHYLGNFVEVTNNDTEPGDTKTSITAALNLGETVDIPYLDYHDLEKHIPDTTASSEKIDSNDYQQIYFDWKTEKFVSQIDPSKVRQLDALTNNKSAEVMQIIARLVNSYDTNPRTSNQGTQTSKLVHETYKPFKYYRAPLMQLKSIRTFRYALDNGYRVVASAVTTQDGTKGIILHFSGTHDQYNRWVNRHR